MMLKQIAFGAAVLLLSASASSAAPAPVPGYQQAGAISGADGGWDLSSVDPIAHRLYLARTDGVMAVDLQTKKVTPIVLPAQRGHAALAIPGTREVLLTNGASKTAVMFDGVTGNVRATIPTGTKPDAAAWDPFTKTLWVMNTGSGDMTVIDPVSAHVLATVPIGGSLELGAADGEGRLFVNIEDRNDVAVIDTRTRKLVAQFPLAGCDGPTGIAYAPDAKLLVSACANGKAIVSSRDGHQVASLDIGPRPDGALYDEQRHLALIPSGGDGTLAVIKLDDTPRVIDRIPTAKSARTAALDPATGNIYLPAADYAAPVGQERAKIIPGSFRIIVLTPAQTGVR